MSIPLPAKLEETQTSAAPDAAILKLTRGAGQTAEEVFETGRRQALGHSSLPADADATNRP